MAGVVGAVVGVVGPVVGVDVVVAVPLGDALEVAEWLGVGLGLPVLVGVGVGLGLPPPALMVKPAPLIPSQLKRPLSCSSLASAEKTTGTTPALPSGASLVKEARTLMSRLLPWATKSSASSAASPPPVTPPRNISTALSSPSPPPGAMTAVFQVPPPGSEAGSWYSSLRSFAASEPALFLNFSIG